MDRKIKTRQVHKDIKVLDKTVTVTDHVKQSYVRTKENIMQSTEKSSDRENNPVGYAEDAASKYADRIFHETGHQVRRQAGKIIERKKEKASVSSSQAGQTISLILSVYWPLITCIYFIWSFLFHSWSTSWLIWPLASVVRHLLYSVLDTIEKEQKKAKKSKKA